MNAGNGARFAPKTAATTARLVRRFNATAHIPAQSLREIPRGIAYRSPRDSAATGTHVSANRRAKYGTEPSASQLHIRVQTIFRTNHLSRSQDRATSRPPHHLPPAARANAASGRWL